MILHYSLYSPNTTVELVQPTPRAGRLFSATYAFSAVNDGTVTGASVVTELTRGSDNPNRGASLITTDGPLLAIWMQYFNTLVANPNQQTGYNRQTLFPLIPIAAGQPLKVRVIGSGHIWATVEVLLYFQ